MHRKCLFLLTILLTLAGCSSTTEYQRPAAELPAAYRDAPMDGVKIPADRWWSLYSDAALDKLVDEALAYNQDLALATARVDEARALARSVDAQRAPAFSAAAGRERTRSSAVAGIPMPPGTPLERNDYNVQLNVAYEVDLWGRLSSASSAARADLLATEAARGIVRIALASEVVRGYYSLVALDAQLAATRRALALRNDSLNLQKVRAKAGLINDFTLRQLEAEVASAQAQLPAHETSRTTQELALAVLLGRSPRAITKGKVERASVQGAPLAPVVPEGLPSELLLRRPDVAQAEQRLIAANARINAARASLFPRISLTGAFGSESATLGDLFTAPARIWTLAFALAQPIFQAGRLQSEVEATQARERQALAQYQKTLQEAFREVRQALNAQMRAREAYDAEGARGIALTEASKLARIRYENGLLSQIEVLDAERNLLQAELNRSEALRLQRAAVADLVKALGGGWSAHPSGDTKPPDVPVR